MAATVVVFPGGHSLLEMLFLPHLRDVGGTVGRTDFDLIDDAPSTPLFGGAAAASKTKIRVRGSASWRVTEEDFRGKHKYLDSDLARDIQQAVRGRHQHAGQEPSLCSMLDDAGGVVAERVVADTWKLLRVARREDGGLGLRVPQLDDARPRPKIMLPAAAFGGVTTSREKQEPSAASVGAPPPGFLVRVRETEPEAPPPDFLVRVREVGADHEQPEAAPRGPAPPALMLPLPLRASACAEADPRPHRKLDEMSEGSTPSSISWTSSNRPRATEAGGFSDFGDS